MVEMRKGEEWGRERWRRKGKEDRCGVGRREEKSKNGRKEERRGGRRRTRTRSG